MDTELTSLVADEQKDAAALGLDYVLSVIIPVYNTEAYVGEAIESVLAQTAGCDCTQIVLVDDGSSDGSAAVCERYATEHPQTIVFVRQENQGVSAARNAGLALARGLWVNFLDSDDRWSDDALEALLRYHHAHPELNIVSMRHYFFGAQEGPHALDYKYEHDRIVNIHEEPAYPQLSFSNLFVRMPLMKDVRFDTTLRVSEDFAQVNEVLMDEGVYGICARGTYWYRKRFEGGSAIDTSTSSVSYYVDTPKNCYLKLFDSSRKRFGRVIPYVQHCVMYDLVWRLRRSIAPVLTAQQAGEYRSMLHDLLGQIDDEVIVAQRQIRPQDVLTAYAIKYDTTVPQMLDEMRFDGTAWLWQAGAHEVELPMEELDPQHIYFDFITIGTGHVALEGFCCALEERTQNALRIDVSAGGVAVPVTYTIRYDKSNPTPSDEEPSHLLEFACEIPWDGEHPLDICLNAACKGRTYPARFIFCQFVPLNERIAHSYFEQGGACVTFGRGTAGESDVLHIQKASGLRRALLEAGVRRDLIASEGKVAGAKLVLWRIIGGRMRRERVKAHKQVWLISDRPMKAGDNGEAFFSYLCAHPLSDVEPVFALSKDSPDWERLSQLGKTVDFGSRSYQQMFLRANLWISSAGEGWVYNAFGDRKAFLHDLYGGKFVFLQHGVIKDDLFEWLNRYNKDMSLFMTSARREWESILRGHYGYDETVVRQIGLPRHDALVREAAGRAPSRTIYVMPTWRKNLTVGACDYDTGMYVPNPSFERSGYYRFYQALLDDEHLQAMLERYDYRLKFVLHPSFLQEESKFKGHGRTEVVSHCDYREAFIDGSLLVTDYSSVAFDFALLQKPILYAQFDRDTFFAGHSYQEGYYDYERDGFGPVCTTTDELIAAIETLLAHGCTMPDTYRTRVEEFFGEQPTSRCAVLAEELHKLGEA